MSERQGDLHIYEGSGDELADHVDWGNRIVLLPDAPQSQRDHDPTERVRIMWGQRLIDDLMAGRYRVLVCAVNAVDNSHGIINLLAQRLPTSQWDHGKITDQAKRFVQEKAVTIVKYDMDCVQVMGLLRPSTHEQLTLADIASGFRIIGAMLRGRPERTPAASVCFLGARANRLVDDRGKEPSFETVLSAMYGAGYRGDVYPAPWMWESAPKGVFPRYPFPESFKEMCNGGF